MDGGGEGESSVSSNARGVTPEFQLQTRDGTTGSNSSLDK